MSHVHHDPVVTEERTGVSLVAVVLVVLLVGLLIWFIAFSGMVMDRGNDGPTKVENNEGDNTTIINPGDTDTDTDSGTGTDTEEPAPATSP